MTPEYDLSPSQKARKIKKSAFYTEKAGMKNLIFLSFFIVTALSMYLFNGCSRAGYGGAFYSLSNSPIPTAPEDANSPEKEDPTDNTSPPPDKPDEEPPPPPDKPSEFNYFPYDLQMDTLGYMGCPSANEFFTFKMGSYFSKSGMRLSEYFLRQKNKLSSTRLKELIKTSTKYQAAPQIHLSSKSNFLNKFKEASFGFKLNNFIDDMIEQSPRRIGAIRGDPIEARTFISSFDPKHDRYKKTLLILSYRGPSGIYHKTKGEKGVDIYGRLYDLDYESVSESRYVLSSVEEEKLPEGGPSQPDWTCPDKLKLQIRRHPRRIWKKASFEAYLQSRNMEHQNIPSQDEQVCEDSNNGGSALLVAQALLGDDFNININDKCISPKNTSYSCYRRESQNNWRYRMADRDSTNCGQDEYGLDFCPQYLSICIRNNLN